MKTNVRWESSGEMSIAESLTSEAVLWTSGFVETRTSWR